MRGWVRLAMLAGAIGSSLLFALVFALRAGGNAVGAAAMIPLGGERAVLLASPWRGSIELTYVTHWPSVRIGAWAGMDWRNVGPFLSWAIYRETRRTSFVYREGTVMVPLAAPGGVVAYEGSYDRATALGYPDWLAPPPNTAVVTAHQVGLPHMLVLACLAVLPAAYLLMRRREKRQQMARRRAGLCVACGYDLRATPEVCPECGAEAAVGPITPRSQGRWLGVFAFASLVLWGLATVLCIRGFCVADQRSWSNIGVMGDRLTFRKADIDCDRGVLQYSRLSHQEPLPAAPLPSVRAAYERARTSQGLSESRWRHSTPGSRRISTHSMGAWGTIEGQVSDNERHLLLAVRLPTVIVASALLPTVWLWRRMRRQ